MNKELDLESYPTLHLHLMVDDYYELIQKKKSEKSTPAEGDSHLDMLYYKHLTGVWTKE